MGQHNDRQHQERHQGHLSCRPAKHVPRYLAQYEYRFNRRYRLEDMIPRLAWVALRTPPMPYRMLKSAEFGA